MRAIRVHPEADRVLLISRTGKGKTTFARFIAEQLQPCRLIVVDPKDELDFGVQKLRTPAELALGMHQPIVHYVPASFDRDSLEEASQIIWLTPGPYILWLDELSELSNPNWCPSGFRLAETQGRQGRKLVIACTQRLAESHPVFRSQASHVIALVPCPVEKDLKMLAGDAIPREPEEIRAELESLHAHHGDFSHLWYVEDGDELRRCQPIPLPNGPRVPPGEGTGPQRPPATALEEPAAESAP